MRHIGVDLHKTNSVACFLAADDTSRLETFPLNPDGISRFKRQLRKADEVAVEVTQNVYYFYDQIRAALGRVVLVDAYRFSVIAKSKKKAERADAAALARFLRLGWLPEVSVPSERVRRLRHLLQARETLVSLTTKLKDMAHAALSRNGVALSRAAFASDSSRKRLGQRADLASADRAIMEAALRQLSALEAEVAQPEAEIVRAGKSLPGLRRLSQVHGLNLLSPIALPAEVGDFNLFEQSKQLVSYAGLATSTRQSNETTRRGAITKQGRKRMRTICIRAVLSMVNKTRTPLTEFYQKKKREKGSGKAICATARKLLTVIFVMLKKGLDYWYTEGRLYNRKLRALDAAA
ncbi:MAG TPA: IS110 family transposase [Pyrinomonadaceae bacterium]|nr:IS110 family transposase [Pyrinomonadaceae bacterium]